MVKNNVSQNRIRGGFSIAEMLVSMLVISIFFVASAKLVTTRAPKEVVKYPHGFFECYTKGALIYTHGLRGQSVAEEEQAPNCNFIAPMGVNFVNIHYTDGAKYFNSQETIIDMKMDMSSPSSIMDAYPHAESSDGYSPADDFKAYLGATHPKSKIYEIWEESGRPPQSALFIAW